MPPRREDEDLGTVLRLLRRLRGWNQEDLGAAAGIPQSAISDYEQDKRRPLRSTRERLFAALELSSPLAEGVRSFLGALREVAAGSHGQPGKTLAEEIETAAAAVSDFDRNLTRAVLPLLVEEVLAAAGRDRQAAQLEPTPRLEAAAALWRQLVPYSAAQREAVVREGNKFRGAALAVRLCLESERAAADSATAARELAVLAVLVAELSAGEPAARSRLEGFCRVHLGNALRAGGTLPVADEAFTRALALWRAGAGGDPLGLLDEARVFSLEASLRRDQRRLPEALALLDRALAIEGAEKRTYLFLNRAKTLEEMGDLEGAIAGLEEALSLLAGGHEPRLLWAARFNLVEVLVRAGRHAKAEPLLAEVGDLAERHASRLDRLRLRWLAGRIAAGRGRAEEAIALLRQVRADFAAEGIAYDTALVTLELAALLAERGATTEVKALARHLVPLFQAQGVGREALASLALFRRAAEQEAVTAELARGLAERLRRDREPQAASALELLP